MVDDVLPEVVDDVVHEVVDDVLPEVVYDDIPEVVDDSNDEEEGCEAGGSDCTSDPIVLLICQQNLKSHFGGTCLLIGNRNSAIGVST